MKMKLFDSELKVMEILWKEGDLTAKQLSLMLADEIGWNKNTTYTVIKKCIEKKVIERQGTNFLCHAIITKEEAQEQGIDELVDRMFEGSTDLLFSSLLNKKNLPEDKIKELIQLVQNQEEQ